VVALPAAAQLLQLSAARALAQKAEKKGDKPLSVALRKEIAKAERQMRGSAYPPLTVRMQRSPKAC
jgi:hypothetical protein